jgi:hypothetical protein
MSSTEDGKEVFMRSSGQAPGQLGVGTGSGAAAVDGTRHRRRGGALSTELARSDWVNPSGYAGRHLVNW